MLDLALRSPLLNVTELDERGMALDFCRIDTVNVEEQTKILCLT